MSCCSPNKKTPWYRTPFGMLALILLISILVSGWHEHWLNLYEIGAVFVFAVSLWFFILKRRTHTGINRKAEKAS